MKPYIAFACLLILLTEKNCAQNSKNTCREFLKTPNFDINYVVGPWRTYYSWGLDMGTRCDDITFKKVTRATKAKDRIAYNMKSYMSENVIWDEAALFASKSRVITKQDELPREMLLFPEKRMGSFMAVHNVNKLDIYLPKKSVPMLPFVFKFFRQGKFLVMSDCSLDISVLMARPNDTIYRLEILSTAAEVSDQEGYQACLMEKNKNELEGLILNSKDM